MRLAIIGSRNCIPIDIEKELDNIPETVVSGGAMGVDTYARMFAKKHNLNLVEYLPDYERYGRGAPLVRNKLIVENCDSVLAFWDGQSRGTKFTLDYAKELGKPVKIVKI